MIHCSPAPGNPLLALICVLTVGALPANGQWSDTFADGNFTNAPPWSGEVALWTIVPFGVDYALQTNGPSASDTLSLVTASQQSYGRWSLTIRYEGGALSNFNQLRVYLISDQPNLEGPLQGYYLQLGTNRRDLRLYRVNPGGRFLMEQSAEDLFTQQTRTLRLEVNRVPPDTWTIFLDGEQVLAVATEEPGEESSRYFGFWVKHSSSRSRGYLFDDIDVQPLADTSPPVVHDVSYSASPPQFSVTFSEPIAFHSVDEGDIRVEPLPVAPTITSTSGTDETTGVDLLLEQPLSSGEYSVFLGGIADLAGNVMADTTVTVRVEADDRPPVLLGAEALSSTEVEVRFDEPAAVAAFEFSGGVAVTERLTRAPFAAVWRLTVAPPLRAGQTYRLTVRDVIDQQGNVLGADSTFFLFEGIPEAPLPGDVIINEIMYAPPAFGAEYVELHNPTDRTYDLSRLYLEDDREIPVLLSDTPRLLPPGAFAVLTGDSLAFSRAFPGRPFHHVPAMPTLNNGGDLVRIRMGTVVIDAVRYAPSWGGEEVSLERRDPRTPSQMPANWGSSLAPEGGTPGAQNTLFAPDLIPPRLLFADQVGDQEVEVFFDEPLDTTSLSPPLFRLDSMAPVSLHIIDEGTRLRLSFPGPLAGTRLSARALSDWAGNQITQAETPLFYRPEPGEIILNEIMYAPRADPADGRIDQPEYIELFNRSERYLTLRGAFFTDAPDEHGSADTTRFAPVLSGLAPGSFAVLFTQPEALAPEDLPTQSSLALAFPADYEALSVVLLPVRRATLGLLNGGDLIRLHRQDHTRLEEVRYDPAWQDASRAETEGVALERVDPEAPADLPTNWGSSQAPEGGTPGRPNSLELTAARVPSAGDLVINEILYEPLADPHDHRPDQPEFVELYNRSGMPLQLNGLLLTGRIDELGRADTLRVAYTPKVLPDGAFAVIYSVPAALPDDSLTQYLTTPFPGSTGDAVLLPVRRSLSLDNAGDQIQLLAPDHTPLDAVSYDPRWHHPNLRTTRGTSLERIDFAAPSSSPDNWTSSVAPSGATPGAHNSVQVSVPLSARTPGLRISPSPFSPDRDGYEDVTAIRYTLREAPALLRTRIYDAHGRLVRTLQPTALGAAEGVLFWDGLDDQGRSLRIGIYVVHLEAVAPEAGTTEAHKAVVVLARPFR